MLKYYSRLYPATKRHLTRKAATLMWLLNFTDPRDERLTKPQANGHNRRLKLNPYRPSCKPRTLTTTPKYPMQTMYSVY